MQSSTVLKLTTACNHIEIASSSGSSRNILDASPLLGLAVIFTAPLGCDFADLPQRKPDDLC